MTVPVEAQVSETPPTAECRLPILRFHEKHSLWVYWFKSHFDAADNSVDK